MANNTLLLLLVLLLSGHLLWAQSDADSTLQIETIIVTDSRLPISGIGSRQDRLDSMQLHMFKNENLGEALSFNSQAYIRSYGPGRLTSGAIRGAAAVHTAVIWNGFNLQNPLLGLTDLSLFPVNFIDAVRVEYGGGTALWGSGALGGAVHLNTIPEYGNGFHTNVQSTMGSYSNFTNSAQVHYGSERFSTSTRFLQQNAKNNFPFTNLSGKAVDLPHAKVQQFGILHEDFLRLSTNQQLGFHAWWQQAKRELPPTLFENESFAKQEDRILRLAADWQHIGNQLNIYVRAGAFREQLNYEDQNPAFQFSSEDVFWTMIGEVESKIIINKYHALNIGVNNTWTQVESPTSLPDTKQQNRTALFAAYHVYNKMQTLRTVLSARQELLHGALVPFVPSLGIEWELTKAFVINGAASRNYRLPTFSDLYSSFGGNPDLKPENGWSEELGLTYHKSGENVNIQYNISGFNRNIDNWIVWLPTDSTGFNYAPRNVRAVHSRGIENTLEVNIKTGNAHFIIIGKYDFIKSTNKKVAAENVETLDKQLIYIPQNKGSAQMIWRLEAWEAAYRHSFIGKVYTNDANTATLSPFQLGDISVSKAFNFNKIQLNILVKIHNIWNENYQMQLGYPMPGRNFEVSVKLGY